ncbi:Adhesin domain-containing protein [Frankia sp. AiPs1]|nr:hypothetical protein [Frankia sp. AiPa1]
MLDTLVVVIAVVLLAAALGGLSLLRLPPAELVHTVDGIDAIEVRVAVGRVEVADRDRGDVRVELTVRRRPGRSSPRVTTLGSLLRIDGRYSEVRVRLAVPVGTRVRAEVLTGEITLWGAAGELSLVTRDGTIAGRELGALSATGPDAAGPVAAATSVPAAVPTAASGTAAASVAARSQNGDVSLHFACPPAGVHAQSESGLVTVMLPDAEYDVSVEAGDPRGVQLDLASVPGAERRVVARTVSGQVQLGITAPLGPLPI